MPALNQLILDHLACDRGETRLFEGCSLTVENGQWWQIEGHNGIGKTSLLRIIAGLSQPAYGQVLWNGTPIQHQRETYHANLFYLGHFAGIKPELTAWENLQHHQKLHNQPAHDDTLWHALDQVSLIGREDLPCSHLSAGQQRRVALAKLWLTHAKLWILDEPFTAIDPKGVTALTTHIEQHCQQGGLCLFTSHQRIESKYLSRLYLSEFAT